MAGTTVEKRDPNSALKGKQDLEEGKGHFRPGKQTTRNTALFTPETQSSSVGCLCRALRRDGRAHGRRK